MACWKVSYYSCSMLWDCSVPFLWTFQNHDYYMQSGKWLVFFYLFISELDLQLFLSRRVSYSYHITFFLAEHFNMCSQKHFTNFKAKSPHFFQGFGLGRWLLWHSEAKRCHGEPSWRFVLQKLQYDFVIHSNAKYAWWNSWKLSSWICCCWNVACFSCCGERVILLIFLVTFNMGYFGGWWCWGRNTFYYVAKKY